jgi:type VI secretion system secreted protein VgrG
MNLSITTGAGMFASIRSTLRLFVQKAGMKLIAAAGDVDVKALSDSINLLAKLNISQSANRITISAKEEVIISGGGSYVRFDANGIEHGTAAEFVAHAASHSFVGPQHLDAVHQAEFARARPRKYSQQVVVDKALFVLPDGKRNATYTFLSDVHAVLGSGTLDDDGKSARLYSDVAHAALVKIDVNAGKWQQLITDRLEQVNSPVSAHQAVFDYPEHDTVAERADMDDIGAADGCPDHG